MARTSIILHGGLLRMACPALHFKAVNIALLSSPAWLNGILILDKTPYYRLLPIKDNYIEIKSIKNNYYLAVNDQVIYEKATIFGYTINVALNKAIPDTPYDNFFRYY
jgi:hypothetical protein